MKENDEMTAIQLHKKFTDTGFSISSLTILCCRNELGWTFRGIAITIALQLYVCGDNFCRQ